MIRSFASVLIFASLVASTGCETGSCPIPKDWKLATSLEPSPVPYTPRLLFFAQETKDGRWLWRGQSVTYEALLRDLALVRSLNPKPSVLFKFADVRSCRDLNKVRGEIAKAAKCSEDFLPCLEGTIAEFEAHT